MKIDFKKFYKACSKCGTITRLDGFSRDDRRSDKSKAQCKCCQASYDRTYRYGG